MALLKAFVLQVVLFGLYKLFLEQVVEQHLVPDDFKRNCLVGLVGLLCFGIQLYTDKSDDEIAEADENPKSISAEISVTYETSSAFASPVSVGKSESTLRVISTEKKMPPEEPQAEMIEVRHSSFFADFSPNVSGKIPIDGITVEMGEPEIPSSTAPTSCGQDKTTAPVLNGFSETIVDEESDEEAIEIDQFVAKQLRIKNEPIQAEDVTNESNGLTAIETDLVESINIEDEAEDPKQPRVTEVGESIQDEESEQVEVIKEKDVTKTVVESGCLSANGQDVSPEDMGQTSTLNSGKSSEAEITNGIHEESSNINNIALNIIKSKDSVREEETIIYEQDVSLSSGLDHGVKDVKEFKTSAEETNKTSSTPKEKDIETISKNCIETSKLVKTLSSSNNLTVASATQKMTVTEEVCVAPLLIDISFIYACH